MYRQRYPYRWFSTILFFLSLISIQVSLAQNSVTEAQTAAPASKWGLPDSPTGQASAAYLEAVHRKDIDYTRTFIEEKFAPSFKSAFPLEEHIEQFQWMHENIGELELISAKKTSDTSCELSIQSKENGQHFTAKILVEQEPPHQIASISVEAFRVFEITESAKDTIGNQSATDNSQLTDITQFEQLAKDFHQDNGDVRLITLLSPT